MTGGGLPHSEISGSKRACRSPKLIAAYRVLRRLMMPRHPSCARIRLAEDRNLRHLVYVAILLPRLCSCQRATPPKRGNPFRAETAAGLVGVPGVEPGTSSLSGTRSNQLSYPPAPPRAPPPRALSRGGGGSRGRTGDIQLAKLALCQLSYAPGGRLSRRSLKRCSGRQSRSGRDAEDFFLHSQD